jgi:ABC-2 type transport system permease protein
VSLNLDASARLAAERRAAALEKLPMEPAGPTQGFWRGAFSSIHDIWGYRGLLNLLYRRELKARYKDSALGFVWSLLRPLALLAVYYIAVGKFLGAAGALPDYAVYVFSGITAWGLFSEIVASGTGSILANSGLVKKIYLPREVFPLSVVGSALFNFVMQLIVLVAATLIVGAPPWGTRLFYGVGAALLLIVWGTAFAFIFSAVNVYLRDVQYLVEIALLWGMWTAPIVYLWTQVSQYLHGIWETIYLANPIADAVLGFHKAFWVSGDTPSIKNAQGQLVSNYPPHVGTYIAINLCVGIVALWLCQRVFARLEANFAQEL